MSYARFSYADVYVYLDMGGYLNCCGCLLQDTAPTTFSTTADLLQHLAEHKKAGHNVPDDTIAELKADAAENDAWIAKVEDGMCSLCGDRQWVQNPPPEWIPCYSCNPDGKLGAKPEASK